MSIVLSTLWISTLAVVVTASAFDDEGDALLKQSLTAHGGLQRFHAISDWHIVADRVTSSGSETYDEFLLREGGATKTLLVKTQPEAVLVFGHDGERGFALTNGVVTPGEGAESEGYYRAHGEYYLRSLPFKWADPGILVAYAGTDTDGERELDLLRISATEGTGRAWKDVWIAAIDRSTRLLYEARLTHERAEQTWVSPPPSGPAEITYRYTDYRDVDGLQVAFRMEYFSGGRKTGQNVIRAITLDDGVEAEIFSGEHHRR